MSRPHDRLFHAAFSRIEALREFLPRHLEPAVLASLDLGRLEVVQASFLDPQLQEHFADLLVSVGLRQDAEAWIYLLLEHKSHPDRLTPLQLLRYMALIWHQDVQAARAPRAIVPVVVYHGPESWPGGGMRSLLAPPAPLERFVPSFDWLLVDLTRVPDDVLLQGESPELRVVAFTLKHVFTGLKAHLGLLARELDVAARRPDGEAFLRKVVTYLGEAAEELEPEDLVRMLETIPGGRRIMPTIADIYRAEGHAEGRAEGVQEGITLAQRRFVSEILLARFAQVPTGLEERLALIESLGRIEQLQRAALATASLAEFERLLDD